MLSQTPRLNRRTYKDDIFKPGHIGRPTKFSSIWKPQNKSGGGASKKTNTGKMATVIAIAVTTRDYDSHYHTTPRRAAPAGAR